MHRVFVNLVRTTKIKFLVRHREFNLILLDVIMPDVNGYEVLPEMRSLVGEQVAIVMASAHSHAHLVQVAVL